MRVSTKGRYGLRILLDVALNEAQGPVVLKDIAQRQAISQKYLWQVIHPLKSAGIVNSVRGAHGGYVLARKPEDITLLEIVETLEGASSLVECVMKPSHCERSDVCVARSAWVEVEQSMRDAMKAITIRDLLLRHHEHLSRQDNNYII